jgi:hypothetical protein
MLSHTTVSGLNIVPPKQESGLYETDSSLPKMHCVCLVVGKRNSGKTVSTVNLIEKMKFDYVIAISPTMNSNREIMERLNIEFVFEDVDDLSCIDSIKKIVEDEARDLDRYKHQMKEYNTLMKNIKNGNIVNEDHLLTYFAENEFIKPKHRWGGKKPRIALLVDDCLGSGIYSKPRKLNALSTYSRHLGQLTEGGSIGVSLFFLIQSFKCQIGGLNKVIRNQATQMILFRTKDEGELNDIACSVSGEISKEQFLNVYEYAMADPDPYPFLFIDLHKKSEHPSMFRIRFDKFIIIPPEVLEDKMLIDTQVSSPIPTNT